MMHHRFTARLAGALCLLMVAGLVTGCSNGEPSAMDKERLERQEAEASAKAAGWVEPTLRPEGTPPTRDPFEPLYYADESPSLVLAA